MQMAVMMPQQLQAIASNLNTLSSMHGSKLSELLI
jgi:hypothetical protein